MGKLTFWECFSLTIFFGIKLTESETFIKLYIMTHKVDQIRTFSLKGFLTRKNLCLKSWTSAKKKN